MSLFNSLNPQNIHLPSYDSNYQLKEGDVDIFQEALDLGMVDGYGNIICDNVLSEAAETKKIPVFGQQKSVIVAKDSRFNRLSKRASLIIARQRKDPDYLKWKEAMKLAVDLRSKLEMKYNGEAKNRAKEIIANSKMISQQAPSDMPAVTSNGSAMT